MQTYLERNPNLKARQGTPVVVSRDDTAELFAPMPLADVDARWLEEPLPQDEDRRSLATIRPVARSTAPEAARLGPQEEIVAIADIGTTETGTN